MNYVPPKVNASKPVERIDMTLGRLDEIEKDILLRRHIERYAIVRQFVYGQVVDFACGVGYGTYLLSKNPDVEHIYGVDIDQDAIDRANEEFGRPNITFVKNDIRDFRLDRADVLISLETAEHLEDPTIIFDFAVRSGVKEAIVSFPSKKTTHYNRFHMWDLTLQDISDIFSPNFIVHNSFSFTFDTQFVHLLRVERDGAGAKRYSRKA